MQQKKPDLWTIGRISLRENQLHRHLKDDGRYAIQYAEIVILGSNNRSKMSSSNATLFARKLEQILQEDTINVMQTTPFGKLIEGAIKNGQASNTATTEPSSHRPR